MDRVDGHMVGTKILTDRKSKVMMSPPKSTAAISCRGQLTRQKKKQPWRYHQSLSAATGRKCSWARCPGIEKSKGKQKHTYDTCMRCEECTTNAGCNMQHLFLFVQQHNFCNDTKNSVVVSCHVAYHKCNHNKAFLLDKCY